MSGIEIAGIVLGAFPIAISALEKYRSVATVFGFWWEIRLEYQKCKGELNYHHICFIRNLKQLLLPLLVEDSEVQQLIANPGGPLWCEQRLSQQLKDRLQESYELYVEIVQQLGETIEELNRELAVDKTELQEKIARPTPGISTSKLSPTSKSLKENLKISKPRREYELYRLKFSLGESNRVKLFEELKKYNERLEKLLSTSDTVKQLQSIRNPSTNQSKTTISITERQRSAHAAQLYSALCCAWNCTCSEEHCANMMLQHCTPPRPEFRLLFLSGIDVTQQVPSKWPAIETEIQLTDMDAAQHQDVVVLPAPAQKPLPNHRTSQPSKPAITRTMNTPSRIKVKVPEIAITSAPSTGKVAAHQLGSLPAGRKLPDGSEITSLCEYFRLNQKSGSCLGYVKDEQRRYYIKPTQANITEPLKSWVTLDKLLSDTPQSSMSRRQRYLLALTLASSYLQLHGSPWFPPTWQRSDISFFQDHADSKSVHLDQPYIASRFKQTSPAPHDNDRVPGCATLGIVILELCYGFMIDKHPSRARYPLGDGQTKEAFDLLAAIEWLGDVGEEAGPDYAGAVEWCLLRSKTVANKKDWQADLFDCVVQPLSRCFDYLTP